MRILTHEKAVTSWLELLAPAQTRTSEVRLCLMRTSNHQVTHKMDLDDRYKEGLCLGLESLKLQFKIFSMKSLERIDQKFLPDYSHLCQGLLHAAIVLHYLHIQLMIIYWNEKLEGTNTLSSSTAI